MKRTFPKVIPSALKRGHFTRFLLFLLLTIFSASCASTRVIDTWKAGDYQGKAENIVVIMAAKDPESRELFENRFVAKLQARGNRAIQSYKLASLDQLPDKEFVKERAKDAGADTVLISRLVNLKTIESYVPGQKYVIPSAHYGWGPYYTVIFADYGHTSDTRIIYIETNLYDMKTEKLIWSAHSKTERTEGQQQMITTFADIIIKKLASDRIIK